MPPASGIAIWHALRRYPATLTLYAFGLAALASNNLRSLGQVSATKILGLNNVPESVTRRLLPFVMFEYDDPQRAMRLLEGMDRRHTPLSDWIHTVMRQYLGTAIHSDEQYDLLFDRLEILMSLSHSYHLEASKGWFYTPMGSFVHRTQNRLQIVGEIEESIATLQHMSPFVTGAIFGNSLKSVLR